jgi:hypothetical protein
MGQCIYCRKPLTRAVPPEHVIPQSFGTFKGNLTLFCVCEECNRYFGSTLEWTMRNSSAEGVLRFNYGLATGGQVGNIGTKGIEFRIAEAGDWLGARVVLKVNKDGEGYVDVLPQVGARRDAKEEWTWYLEKDVTTQFAAEYPKGSEFRIIGCQGDFERLEKRLIAVCPTFRKHGTLTPPIGKDGKVGLNFVNDFNAVVRRFLAKIAFNYLAWVAGAEFALRSEFDGMRNFVRSGTEPSHGGVYVGPRPILAQEILGETRITDGHIITIEAKPDEHRVQAQLSLFNSLKYRIVLSGNYDGIWFAKGHHFDVQRWEVSELASTPVVPPVPV